MNNLRTLEQLRDDLIGCSYQAQLHALEDGAFLADYDVTEAEIEALYHEIESSGKALIC